LSPGSRGTPPRHPGCPDRQAHRKSAGARLPYPRFGNPFDSDDLPGQPAEGRVPAGLREGGVRAQAGGL